MAEVAESEFSSLIFLKIYLAESGISCDAQDLSMWHRLISPVVVVV